MEYIDVVVYRNIFGDYEATNLSNLLSEQVDERRVAHFKMEDFDSVVDCANFIREFFVPQDGSIKVYEAQDIDIG